MQGTIHTEYFWLKNGTIKVFNSYCTLINTLLRVTGINTSCEQGLLSMAFYPVFLTNGHIYIYYTGPWSGGNCIVNVALIIPPASVLYIEPGANLIITDKINATTLKSLMRKVKSF
jgi:hypothetical protein